MCRCCAIYMRLLCLGITQNYLCALGFVIAKIFMRRLFVVIHENYMLLLSLLLQFICAGYVVIAEIYMRKLCHYR